MSREKYYTHAVRQRQKYYEAEAYYWFLRIREALHNPQFYYEEKWNDITLYFSPGFPLFSLFFFRSTIQEEEKPEERKLLLVCIAREKERKTYESTRRIK
jgi:hypothetical protein